MFCSNCSWRWKNRQFVAKTHIIVSYPRTLYPGEWDIPSPDPFLAPGGISAVLNNPKKYPDAKIMIILTVVDRHCSCSRHNSAELAGSNSICFYFVKSYPIFQILSQLKRVKMTNKNRVTSPTSPELCCCTTLWNVRNLFKCCITKKLLKSISCVLKIKCFMSYGWIDNIDTVTTVAHSVY